MTVTVTPKTGDRAAWDTGFPDAHAKDIDEGTFIYHKDPNTPGGGATALNDLTDVNVPTPTDGQVLTWNDNPSGGEWVAETPTVTNAFTDLTDVPASYTGQMGKVVAVKATEDGLEFVVATGTGDMTKAVYDPDNDGTVSSADTASTADLASDLDIGSLTEENAPTTGDMFIMERSGVRYKVDADNLPGGTAPAGGTDIIMVQVFS